MAKPLPAWLVFYGTRTAIVRADNEEDAFVKFHDTFAPRGADGSRLIPPRRDEVTIRQPRESDIGWLEESDKREFLSLLRVLRRPVTH